MGSGVGWGRWMGRVRINNCMDEIKKNYHYVYYFHQVRNNLKDLVWSCDNMAILKEFRFFFFFLSKIS